MSRTPFLFVIATVFGVAIFHFAHSTPNTGGPGNTRTYFDMPPDNQGSVFSRMAMEMSKNPSPEPEEAHSTPQPVYVIDSSKPGYIRTFGAGASVQIGTMASLSFSIDIKAVISGVLARKSTSFVEALPTNDKESFDFLEESYQGGLNIPFMQWVGANLNETVTLAEMNAASMTRKMYTKLTRIAKDIIAHEREATVRISGSKTITGTSFVPRVYYAYIKVARVNLRNGKSFYVVSSDPADIVVATFDGQTVLERGIEDLRLEILES